MWPQFHFSPFLANKNIAWGPAIAIVAARSTNFRGTERGNTHCCSARFLFFRITVRMWENRPVLTLCHKQWGACTWCSALCFGWLRVCIFPECNMESYWTWLLQLLTLLCRNQCCPHKKGAASFEREFLIWCRIVALIPVGMRHLQVLSAMKSLSLSLCDALPCDFLCRTKENRKIVCPLQATHRTTRRVSAVWSC